MAIKQYFLELYQAIQSIDRKNILFWTAVYVVLVLLAMPDSSIEVVLFGSFITTLFYFAVVVTNYSVIFPRYAKKEKMILYLCLLAFLCLLLTPIKSLFSYLFLKMSNPDLSILSANYKETFLSLFLVGLISSIVKVFMDWMGQQGKMVELETKTTTSELKFLKSQINPHFLFNTLNNLYALTLKKSDHAPEVVLKLSNMMRYMLYECNEKRVPLEKELNYLRNYIDLESLRQSQNVDIKFSTSGEAEHLEISPLIFVPFVENAFKHGLRDNITAGYMHLHFDIAENHLEMTLQNSKPGFVRQNSTRKVGGIGLENVRRRLELIYPEAHQISVDDAPDHYKTTLNLILN